MRACASAFWTLDIQRSGGRAARLDPVLLEVREKGAARAKEVPGSDQTGGKRRQDCMLELGLSGCMEAQHLQLNTKPKQNGFKILATFFYINSLLRDG